MDLNEACLQLQINKPFSLGELKKQYRMMALKYHPNTVDRSSDSCL